MVTRALATVVLVLSLVVLVAPRAAGVAPGAGRAVKIMPLGDSITYGVGSSTSSSYRAGLWNRLVLGAGLDIDLVGSQRSGSLPDTDNEGHDGWRIDQIAAKIGGWLATYTPDVVLVHLGTNDMVQNYDLAHAPERLGSLIDRILAGDPGVTVLVAAIIPSTDPIVNARIAAFDARVPAVVAARPGVRYVDLAGSLTATDMSDSLHPNDAGYDKLAGLWYAALEPVLGGGRDWPAFAEGARHVASWSVASSDDGRWSGTTARASFMA